MESQSPETKQAELSIPEWLSLRARRAGLTAREIASRTTYTESYISLVLNGKRTAWEAREKIQEVIRQEETRHKQADGAARAA